VDFHRGNIDVWFECVGRIGEGREGVTHGGLGIGGENF